MYYVVIYIYTHLYVTTVSFTEEEPLKDVKLLKKQESVFKKNIKFTLCAVERVAESRKNGAVIMW